MTKEEVELLRAEVADAAEEATEAAANVARLKELTNVAERKFQDARARHRRNLLKLTEAIPVTSGPPAEPR